MLSTAATKVRVDSISKKSIHGRIGTATICHPEVVREGILQHKRKFCKSIKPQTPSSLLVLPMIRLTRYKSEILRGGGRANFQP